MIRRTCPEPRTSRNARAGFGDCLTSDEAARLARWCGCRIGSHRVGHRAGPDDDDLDAAVLLPAGGVIVARDGTGFAEAFGANAPRLHAPGDECRAHRVRPVT